MMGYAQILGSFTLDGSLVNTGSFEQVKRKAVVGGHGGGVIGLETGIRRDSGLLRSFGWGSFTNSIGDLLGGGELSTIKNMRTVASSKAIPLLSTPQSILFVDLQLGPGESKTFEYAFTLPRGLPPTHRGKAMKISYSLVIGTQRPGGAKEQQVKSVEIPFRVLGSVNAHGEILGHDLMSPYILLRDQARVKTLEHGQCNHEVPAKSATGPSQASIDSFRGYVEELIATPRDSGHGLLSPTEMATSRQALSLCSPADAAGSTPLVASIKEAVDLAILRANATAAGQQSQNRFEIARNGRRVGVVMLARPAYRLGESVSMAVDFSGAEVPCYAVHAALETMESIVDPTLALRSEASVHRATRKVVVSASEAALFARRVVFAPTIPVSATPEFVTSGVSLEWKIRLEFVVSAAAQQRQQEQLQLQLQSDDSAPGGRSLPRQQSKGRGGPETEGHGGSGTDESDGSARRASHKRRQRTLHPLLEQVSRDDRGGLVLAALEDLVCESFEVAVPLRVYGAVCNGLERLERDEASEEGLPV